MRTPAKVMWDNETMKNSQDSLAKAEKAVLDTLTSTKKSVFSRFPLLFTLLGAFGVACVFAGMNGILSKFELLSNNPFLMLGFGLLILAFTGTLYKKLD